VGKSPVYADVAFDDLTAKGFTLLDGGFEEKDSEWKLEASSPAYIPAIDVFDPQRRSHVFETIGQFYAQA
jgi:hypothetical protein